jgi:putative membrane protein
MTDSDKKTYRKPRAVPLDAPAEASPFAEAEPVRHPRMVRGAVALTAPEDDPFLKETLELPPAAPRRHRGITAGKLLMGSLSVLVSLAVGYWLDSLIRSLFDRLPWLGWVALGFTVLAVLSLLALAWRELRGLQRLEKVADLRAEIERIEPAPSARQARHLVGRVTRFLGNRPQTARGRKALASLDDEIVDGPQLVAFAERELLSTLDREARALVINAARRVSLVTAVSPRASVDMIYVGWEAVRLVRAIAILYGGRPGGFGMMRLFRDVIAHLAITGTVAAGDSILQQAVGHGIAARISSRLGEGVINGLMTARIGISAMDLCRPMPFAELKRPRVSEFFTDLTSLMAKNSEAGTRS